MTVSWSGRLVRARMSDAWVAWLSAFRSLSDERLASLRAVRFYWRSDSGISAEQMNSMTVCLAALSS